MRKSRIAILALAPALLCGCATKCSFADFQKKVGEIDASGVVAKKVVVKGKMNDGKKDYEINYDSESTSLLDLFSPDLIAATLMAANGVQLYAIAEDTNATYYAGSSFKFKAEGLILEWNKYGHCTNADGKLSNDGGSFTVKLSASYTYENK